MQIGRLVSSISMYWKISVQDKCPKWFKNQNIYEVIDF